MRVPNVTRYGRQHQTPELRDGGRSRPMRSQRTNLGKREEQPTQAEEAASELLGLLWGTGHTIVYPKLNHDASSAQWLLQRLLRHSESVLVPIYGEAGERLADICERLGSDVVTADQERGAVFNQDALIAELRRRKPSMLIIAHGDLSTGQMQPLDKLGRACRELDILFLVDVSATAGEVPIRADEWHIDAILTGHGGRLQLPGNLQPLALNEGVKARLRGGKLGREDDDFVREPHIFRSMLQAVAGRLGQSREPEEAIVQRFENRRLYAAALEAGIQAMGLVLFGRQASRLPTVACVEVPEGIDGEALRGRLWKEHGIAIGGQPSTLTHPIWRFSVPDSGDGKMAEMMRLLRSLEMSLNAEGHMCRKGAAVEAASRYWLT